MGLIPNLGPGTRVLYVAGGLALVAAGVWAPFLRAPLGWVVGALGVIVMAEGAIGF